ncbi:MAG: glyoxylate/hydroxypyruvate reductase A [Salinimicrobium sp.]
MSLLIISPGTNPEVWKKAIHEQDASLKIEIYPEVKKPQAVEFALTWKHPHGVFQDFSNLKLIASMGAGIDHIMKDPHLPKNVDITRVVDEKLTADMSLFALALVLDELRDISFHHCSKSWNKRGYKRPEDVNIGIMGLGVLGLATAERLLGNGFKVRGWANSEKDIEDIETFCGKQQLDTFLEQTNFLICLLPLTPETENILDKNLLQKLPKDAYLINVARGSLLVEEDLVEMIKSEHLSGASLDVFRQEPLPEDHPFRSNEKIKITPHNASITSPRSVAPQIVDNYRRMQNNMPLRNKVSRKKGY